MILKYDLNKKQKEFIESPLESSKLIGIPGGGKTTIIICKILNHFKKKDLINTNDFLVTSFSKKACEDFILKGCELETSFGKIFNNGNIKTLHSLAGTIIYALLGKQCSSLQVAIISAINLVKTKTKNDLQKIKCFKNLKIIFVDEAQDLSDIQYELIILLKTKLEINLVLVGDPNQSIYQFQNGSEKYLIEYIADNEYYLEENNRSSPEITNFINYFRPWNSKLPPMISNKKHTSIKPMIFTGTQDEICLRILNEITKSNLPAEKIAIIGPVKKSDKKDDYISVKFGLQRIVNMFMKNNIKFVKHYNDSTRDDDLSNLDLQTKKDHVNLYTIHGSKGLEFDKVILINFHFKTFGKIPTLEEYNHFKYLWYVALSRAKSELLICCDNDKLCWNEMLNCPQKYYEIIGDEPTLKEPKFSTVNHCELSISQIVNNKKIFNEDILLKYYKNINFSECKDTLFKVNLKNLSNNLSDNLSDNLSKNELLVKNNYLILQFFKAVFEYYYGLLHFSKIEFIEEIKGFLTNIVYVNKKYKPYFSNFCAKCDLDLMDTTNISTLIKCKNKLNKDEKKILEYVLNKVGKSKSNFSLLIENDDIFMDSNLILKICDDVFEYVDETKLYWSIFKLCLFKYQYENEAKYLWTNQNSMIEIPNLLSDYLKQIKKIAPILDFDYTFRKKCVHPNLGLTGTIDMITNKSTIIMFKFSESIDLTDKVKIFLWYHSYYNKWNSNMTVEIWNIRTGINHVLKFDPVKTNLYFTCQTAILCKAKLNNMIFVYDLETTGLNVMKCEVIERYMHELTHDVQFSSGVIKAIQKVPKEVIKLTGITQKEVNDGQDFNVFKNEIKTMLELCHKPIFIAHNGNVFDHLVLKFKGVFDGNCKFLDSRIIIRQMSKNKVGNESLSEIYKIVCDKPYSGIAHRAKADVIMILDIFNKINIVEKDILKMC